MEKSKEIWQDSCPSDAMAYLLKSGHLADINIRVGASKANQKIFKCHKFVLASGTPVFEAMFYGNFMEKAEKEIIISDIEPDIFKEFLEYIYTGRALTSLDKYSIESLKSFVYVGKKYLRSNFAEFGYNGLQSAIPNLRFVDLIELFDFTSKMGSKNLTESLSQALKKKTYKTSDFNQALIELDLETFKEFMKCINGASLQFNWIEEYVKRNKLEENSVLKSIQVTKKRKTEGEISTNQCKPENTGAQNWKILLDIGIFENMTTDEFRNGPANSNILKPIEKLNILMDIVQWNSSTVPKKCRYCSNINY